MPTCLAYLRANVLCILTCWRANMLCVLACSPVNVLTCLVRLRAPMSCLLQFSHANVSCVSTRSRLACFACSRANVPYVLCVPTSSRTIATNNKYKFSITCFPYILAIFLCFFSCETKLLHILPFLLPVRSL